MEIDRAKLLELLDELIRFLNQDSIQCKITIYGGSAIEFYHSDRNATVDVDSIFEPYERVKEITEKIAVAHKLPFNWFNSQIHDVLPPKPDDNSTIYYENKGVSVCFASEEYLLAMKSMTSRKSVADLRDAAILFNSLKLKSWQDIGSIVEKYYGRAQADSQELFWEDIENLAAHLKGRK